MALSVRVSKVHQVRGARAGWAANCIDAACNKRLTTDDASRHESMSEAVHHAMNYEHDTVVIHEVVTTEYVITPEKTDEQS